MSLFRKKQPAPTISRDQALAAIPVRNPEVKEIEIDQEQSLILSFPAQVNQLFGRLAQKLGAWDGKPVFRKLQLDAMGTQSWRWIDGKRSVRELCGKLAETYDILPREAEVSMTAFLRELGKKNIIALREGK